VPHKNHSKTKKAISQAARPADGLGTLFPAASDGAGYDDYEQNNTYRNNDDAGVKGANQPICKNAGHEEQFQDEFSLQVFQMQGEGGISFVYQAIFG
jgi:hypothetical protein